MRPPVMVGPGYSCAPCLRVSESSLELFLLAALVWAAFRPRPGTYALLAFVAACFLSLTGGHPQLEFRYLVNPLIAMALLGGVLASDLIAMGRSSIGRPMGYLAAIGGVMLLAPSVGSRPSTQPPSRKA